MKINIGIFDNAWFRVKNSSSFGGHQIMLLLLILIVFTVTAKTNAQTPLPPLVHQLNLNNGIAYDERTGDYCVFSGSLDGAYDRFGIQNGATSFSGPGTGIKITKNSAYPNPYMQRTVSVWVYVGNPSTIPYGAVPFPSGSTHEEIFNLLDQVNGMKFNGIAKVAATLGLNRYIKDIHGTGNVWYLWNYAPIQFDQLGWYHIITSASAYFTRTYMYKPDGNMLCTMAYMGTQAAANNFNVTLGAFNSSYTTPIKYMDDFKLFSDTVSKEQVAQIHANDLTAPSDFYRPVSGKTYRIKNVKSGLYVSLGVFGDPNQIIQQSEDYTGSTHLWQIVTLTSGKILIKNVYSGNNLGLENEQTTNGVKLKAWAESTHALASAEWLLEPSPVLGRFKLKNGFSNKYASVHGASSDPGAIIDQWDDIGENGYWQFEEVAIPEIDENKNFYIINERSRLAAALDNYGLTNNTVIKQSNDDNSGANQIWKLKRVEQGLYKIISKMTDMQLHVYSKDDFTPISQFDQGIYKDGIWRIFEPASSTSANRFFYITNVVTGKCMVVLNASTSVGESIIQHQGQSGGSGCWRIKEMNTTPVLAANKVYQIVNQNSGKNLVLSDFNNNNNTETVQLGNENLSGARHLFKLIKDGEGRYDILSYYTGKSLQLYDGNASFSDNGRPLRQKAQQQNAYQKWDISELRSAPGYFHISNALTGKPISVDGGKTEDGARIFQWGSGTQNTNWQFQEVDLTPKTSSGNLLQYGGIINKNSNKDLELNPRNDDNGSLVVQRSDSSTPWEIWRFDKMTDGKYMLSNRMGYKPIAIEGASIANGKKAMQWQADQVGTNGRWIIFRSKSAPNYWRIANENSGKYIVINNASTADFANVVQWDDCGDNGLWYFIPTIGPNNQSQMLATTKPATGIFDNPGSNELAASTVLTPNGDGSNDKFIVKNIENYPKNSIKIFDKVGRVLYSKKHYTNDWDGSINGSPLNEGTYYYIIDPGNGSPVIKGFINLIRN